MDTITTIPDLLRFNGCAQPVTVSLTPNESRLIAAAPELLAALKAAEEWIGELEEHGFAAPHLLGQIEGALAKAEGRA